MDIKVAIYEDNDAFRDTLSHLIKGSGLQTIAVFLLGPSGFISITHIKNYTLTQNLNRDKTFLMLHKRTQMKN